jgi:hypothetical protein
VREVDAGVDDGDHDGRVAGGHLPRFGRSDLRDPGLRDLGVIRQSRAMGRSRSDSEHGKGERDLA